MEHGAWGMEHKDKCKLVSKICIISSIIQIKINLLSFNNHYRLFDVEHQSLQIFSFWMVDTYRMIG